MSKNKLKHIKKQFVKPQMQVYEMMYEPAILVPSSWGHEEG